MVHTCGHVPPRNCSDSGLSGDQRHCSYNQQHLGGIIEDENDSLDSLPFRMAALPGTPPEEEDRRRQARITEHDASTGPQGQGKMLRLADYQNSTRPKDWNDW